MVNILPISAFSRPLSAMKTKKSVKLKTDSAKKVIKKNKLIDVVSKGPNKTDNCTKTEAQNSKENKSPEPFTQYAEKKDLAKIPDVVKTTSISDKDVSSKLVLANKLVNSKKHYSEDVKPIENVQLKNNGDKTDEASCVGNLTPVTISSNIAVSVSTNVASKITVTEAIDKHKSLEINIPLIEKEKDNKLPNMLDTTLCDGGNARLELAEEFLAASPTAAFLMSFPLVSGNRADSPAEEPQNSQCQSKDQKRNELITQIQTTTTAYLGKINNDDIKAKNIEIKTAPQTENKTNQPGQNKLNGDTASKAVQPKISIAVTQCNVAVTNTPFLNLPMPSLISTCTLSDATFSLDFDCNLNKPIPSQPSSYASNSNIFYKNDPFSTAKSTIYSTSSISSSHEFNGLGLYPCAMDKYSSKNKSEFTNVDDSSLIKMGSSRLTYDIDLGWSHKGLDFVNCTTNAPTFPKDNILTTASSTPFSSSYNPFNPEFHVPFVSSVSKKDVSNKQSSSLAENITNFYSQPSNLWTEEPFYSNSNMAKGTNARHQHYLPLDSITANSNVKQTNVKHYDVKDTANVISGAKSTNHSIGHHLNEKYTKKSPSKMHINWMTSEVRPMQNNCNTTHSTIKEPQKLPYSHSDSTAKRHDNNESNNYFPLSMHNFPTQAIQDDFQVWPSVRPLGTTEISIEPPPINLPTLVGDLALGPHDKKKNLDSAIRAMPQQDLQNCTNFFSVTQLMNRSNDNTASRYQPPQIETTKSFPTKQNVPHYTNDAVRKAISSRVENHMPQPYVFSDSKSSHTYDNTSMTQYSQTKTKPNNKCDKTSKSQKNNYSAEALLRGGNFTQKNPDIGNKFLSHSQKYGDFSATQDTSVAQVSHFPPIIDYSENGYTGQQFSGTSLYNTTTNTLSNSFYTNFMPGSGNLMPGNYAGGPFTGEFIDYNQPAECNYTNHKYEELKMRNNPSTFHAGGDKAPPTYKSSRRDSSATKHKLECSKKEGSKKYQSKRMKLNNEVEEWNEVGHALWQNKGSRKHPNAHHIEELPFPNYVSNQMPAQYQPELLNSHHLVAANVQPPVPTFSHNDRFPVTSRANFNLSTIFPEITMVS